MITEGGAAILLETTRRTFRNQSQSKQRSTLEVLKKYPKLTPFFIILAVETTQGWTAESA